MATLKDRLDNLNLMTGLKLNKLNDLKENKANKHGSLTANVTDPEREYPNIQAVLDGLASNTFDDQKYTDDELAAALSVIANTYINQNEKGAADGVATLDNDAKVPANQLPSFVDDVLEFPTEADFPTTGESGKIYVSLDNNQTWRWSGSGYVQISQSLAIGIVAGTAFEGNRGKALEDAMVAIENRATALENEFTQFYKAMDGNDFPDYATLLDNQTSAIIV